ncbi:MAG: DUF3048 domain-containing protein [Candidatus Altimarinota bacterium]
MRKTLLIIVILIASLIGGYFVFSLAGGWGVNKTVENTSANLLKEAVSGNGKPKKEDEKKPEVIYYSVLDGRKIEVKEDYVVAVVVENEVSSRPQQKGLSKAQIVYEMPAEGGITRYLAIFGRDLPEQVGPLRSARPYLVELAEQFQAVFLHAGGSDDALKAIYGNERILGLNGLVYEGINYFRRDRRYSAPHNLFVRGQDIVSNLGVLKWTFDFNKSYFNFSDQIEMSGLSQAKFINLDFSEKAYEIDYIYQEKTGDYQRYVGGKLHLDGNEAVTPEKVGIVFTEYRPYDQDGRLELRTTGEGEFWLLQKGKWRIGQWQRKDGRMMEFFDQSGEELEFLPGQLFLELIDSKNKLEIN